MPSLNLSFGEFIEDQIYNTNMYFKSKYQESWLDDVIIRKAVLSVDKSRVISESTIESPVFGTMHKIVL